MKPTFILTTLFSTLLTGCGKNSDSHEYELHGKVAEVISCDTEQYLCKAHVFKGPKKKYNEIWTILGDPKVGDKVYRLCSFKIAEIQGNDKEKSAGLSSRNKIEKTLANTNCSTLAYMD